MKPALLLLAAAALLSAGEISTGALLGRNFDRRAFYTRNSPRDAWEKTYTATRYRPEARGKLMGIRPAGEITAESLDFYRNHGLLLVTVTAAFRPDGAPDPAWLARLEGLLAAAGERGMVLNLVYFTAGPDRLFDSPKSIHAAARNLSDWVVRKNFRCLLVEVADEFDAPAGKWAFDGYIPQNLIPLIDEVRTRFRNARLLIPVSGSSLVRTRYSESLAGLADVISLHGAGRPLEQKKARLAELTSAGRPVLMTADDADMTSCDLFFHQASGWCYMPAGADPHTVLDHLAGLTLR